MSSDQNNGCHGGNAPPHGTSLLRDNNAHFHIIGAITNAAAADIETVGPKNHYRPVFSQPREVKVNVKF